jgi:hypothetical protein
MRLRAAGIDPIGEKLVAERAGGAVRQASELSHGLTATLRAMVALILPAYPELDAAARGRVEHDVTRYVAAQVRSMPGFLRLPYQLALLGFEWLPVVRYGRPFRALPPAARAAYLALWSEAPIAAMRDVVKLIRSSALLVYFDDALVMRRLEEPPQRVPALVESHKAAVEPHEAANE